MPILKQVDFEVPGFREFATPPVSVPRYHDAVLALSPSAYWRLSEASGPTLADQTGSHPLTLTGSHSLGHGGALANDADTSLLFSGGKATASAPILPSATNAPFSIAFWARFPAGQRIGGAMLAQFTGNTNGHTRLYILNSGVCRFYVVNQVDIYSTATVGSDWRFVVLTRSATGALRWYIDGELDTEMTNTSFAISPINFLIGNPALSNIVVYLDEVAVFNNDLSAPQVRWLHGLGRAQLAIPTSI